MDCQDIRDLVFSYAFYDTIDIYKMLGRRDPKKYEDGESKNIAWERPMYFSLLGNFVIYLRAVRCCFGQRFICFLLGLSSYNKITLLCKKLSWEGSCKDKATREKNRIMMMDYLFHKNPFTNHQLRKLNEI